MGRYTVTGIGRVADGSRGEQTMYDDAAELLAQVGRALGS
jgi:hypothetical protein